jgi:hypothetical protein
MTRVERRPNAIIVGRRLSRECEHTPIVELALIVVIIGSFACSPLAYVHGPGHDTEIHRIQTHT